MTIRISDRNEAMFEDLRRHNLRHPGAISATVRNIMKAQYLNENQIGKARLEWLRLGYGETKR